MVRIAKMRVHVAPVGYEIDRIVLPAVQEKADRVWLLVHDNKSDDKAVPFVSEITRRLEESGVKVVTESHDRRDLFKIIRAVKTILGQEEGNDVYVNLASGSKIQAIGTMMACMMFNDGSSIHPFYAEAEHYPGFDQKQPVSTGIREIHDVPPYSIRTPEPKLVAALGIIRERGGRLTKKEMAQVSEDKGLITVNAKEANHSMARFASLDKNIIQPLEETWGFIETEKIGRNRWIRITKDGTNAAEFLL